MSLLSPPRMMADLGLVEVLGRQSAFALSRRQYFTWVLRHLCLLPFYPIFPWGFGMDEWDWCLICDWTPLFLCILTRCGTLRTDAHWVGQIYEQIHASPAELWCDLCRRSLFFLVFLPNSAPRVPTPFLHSLPSPPITFFLLWCQKSQLSVNNLFRFKLWRSCCARWSN